MYRIYLICFAISLSSIALANDFNPMQFQAVGNGIADDTQAVQAAINAARAAQGGVTFPAGKIFAIRKVIIYNGIKYLRGGQIKLLQDPSPPSGFNLIGMNNGQPENVKDLTFEDIIFDQNHVDSRVIFGMNVSRIRVNNCTFLNGTSSNGTNGIAYAVLFLAYTNGGEDMYDNVITNNEIYGVYNKGIAISIQSRTLDTGFPASGPGSYWQVNKDVPPSAYKAYNTIIANNYIDGGYYGVGLVKNENFLIENNTIINNSRNIAAQMDSNNGIIRNNTLANPISSSIHVAQGSSYNLIEDNTITTNVSIGEGLLQTYMGASNNVFRNNAIDASFTATGSSPRWMIYVAVHSNNNVFDNNSFSGPARFSYIGVETGWDSDISDPSHRASYASTVTDNYADEGITGLQITNNTFTPGNNTRRILITEVSDANGDLYLTNSLIDNNTIVGEPNYCAEIIYDGITSFDSDLDGIVDACTINDASVTPQNDCPDITNENGQTTLPAPFLQIPENVSCPQPLTVIEYADVDPNSVTFSLASSSRDKDYFSIDQNGLLHFVPFTVPDFENPASDDLDNHYMAVVQITDDNNPNYRDVQIYEVEITDQINEGFADIQIQVILEGAYDNSAGEMQTSLNTLRGLLPGQVPAVPSYPATIDGQPYNTAPWNYSGREGIGWTDSYYSADVVDWVLVSFRTTVNKSSEIAQTAALLMKDGTVEFPDCTVLSAASSPVYIVVEHRNHMGVMSSTPVSMVNGVLSFDFRAANSYISGTGFGQTQVASGLWAMFAGDADQTDFPSYDIQGNDKVLWAVENGNFYRYVPGDFNMDGDINGADRATFEVNNGVFSSVPK